MCVTTYIGLVRLGSNASINASGGDINLQGGINTNGNNLSLDGPYNITISSSAAYGTGGLTKSGFRQSSI
jgi:hypothetical protein